MDSAEMKRRPEFPPRKTFFLYVPKNFDGGDKNQSRATVLPLRHLFVHSFEGTKNKHVPFLKCPSTLISRNDFIRGRKIPRRRWCLEGPLCARRASIPPPKRRLLRLCASWVDSKGLRTERGQMTGHLTRGGARGEQVDPGEEKKNWGKWKMEK